jgi:hypothetical protein
MVNDIQVKSFQTVERRRELTGDNPAFGRSWSCIPSSDLLPMLG